jgi:hypothetical protein
MVVYFRGSTSLLLRRSQFLAFCLLAEIRLANQATEASADGAGHAHQEHGGERAVENFLAGPP